MWERGCFPATILEQLRRPCRPRHPYAVPRTFPGGRAAWRSPNRAGRVCTPAWRRPWRASARAVPAEPPRTHAGRADRAKINATMHAAMSMRNARSIIDPGTLPGIHGPRALRARDSRVVARPPPRCVGCREFTTAAERRVRGVTRTAWVPAVPKSRPASMHVALTVQQ
jgi:hypothetical protein